MEPTVAGGAASAKSAQGAAPERDRPRQRYTALAVAIAVLAYLILVFCHVIKKDDRLGTAELALLVVSVAMIAVLLNPDLIGRIARLKVSGFEVELDRIQKNQEQQEEEIDGIRFVLSLLLKDEELKHLRNLQSGDTQGYVGNGAVRAELGKLADLRLIERLPGRRITEFRDNARLDLRAIMRLTTRGEDFLRRLPDFKPHDGSR